jgi:RNA polymerase-interacting CarD/CdnL/TRCF family regulator
MASQADQYSIGKWVVHCRYGVGQITAIEDKPFYDGENRKRSCYKVETNNGDFWFSADQSDNPRIRTIATPRQFRLVLKKLKKPPQHLEADKSVLKQMITQLRTNVELEPMVGLVRELFARNQIKTLSTDEDQALNKYTKHLTMEYAVSFEMDVRAAKSELLSMLRASDREAGEKFFFGLGSSA